LNKVVKVLLRKSGNSENCESGVPLSVGDQVVVELATGLDFGEVMDLLDESGGNGTLKPTGKVVRKAAPKDLKKVEELRRREKKAESIAIDKIKEHELSMKLVDVKYLFDESKVIFYFTADGRVDFRNLVKDLARVIRRRVEMKQIGVRDEARMIGGLGPCGRDLCCASFLFKFEPVSIKMAREQNLPLNPMKISGLCGRLMCCLKYEYDFYCQFCEQAPSIGTVLETEKGRGEVVEYNVMAGTVVVELEEGLRVEVPLGKLKKLS
jgi:cell fate regulator YaaT (PSP1 superfamily)